MSFLKLIKKSNEQSEYYEENEEYISDGIRYDEYHLTASQRLKYTLMAAFALFVIGFLFYRSLILAVILACLGVFYPRLKSKSLMEERQKQLSYQFKEGLYSLSVALMSGLSIEKAFEEAASDLRKLYGSGEGIYIIDEFELIVHKLKLNMNIERAMEEFAERTGVEDIMNFSAVFNTCKKTSGDIESITQSTSDIIGDKMQIEQEIETLIAEKRMEQKVLNIMPLAMIGFLSISSGDFMKPVFTTVAGHVVMTIALALFGLSYMISKKIMNIEV